MKNLRDDLKHWEHTEATTLLGTGTWAHMIVRTRVKRPVQSQLIDFVAIPIRNRTLRDL